MEVAFVCIGLVIAALLWRANSVLTLALTELQLANIHIKSLDERFRHQSTDRLSLIHHRETIEKRLNSLGDIALKIDSTKSVLITMDQKLELVTKHVIDRVISDKKKDRLAEISDLSQAINSFAISQELSELVNRHANKEE
jgi:polyribonucleotide nucleotidyltransferase